MNSQGAYTTGSAYLQRLWTVGILNLLVQFMFFMVTYFLARIRLLIIPDTKDPLTEIFSMLIPPFMALGIPLGLWVLAHFALVGQRKEALVDKMDDLETGYFLYWTVLSCLSGLSLMAYVLTAEQRFWGMFGVMVVTFLVTAPTMQRCVRYLQLSHQHTYQFENELDVHETLEEEDEEEMLEEDEAALPASDAPMPPINPVL